MSRLSPPGSGGGIPQSDLRQGRTTVAPRSFAGRLVGVLVAGALALTLATVVAGFLLRAAGARDGAETLRRFLAAGGWLWLPMWGAAAGALAALRWTTSPRSRAGAAALASLLILSPLVLRPVLPEEFESARRPGTAMATGTAIRRWAYRSPASVTRILPYAADSNPIVREQAVLALGINLIVSDVEHAGPGRPARFAASPLRDSLRVRLSAALGDPVEAVRAEAARALLKAPITFGFQGGAAETLAAVLDRAGGPEAIERLTWLALDATAVTDEQTLRAAAGRFASRTPDRGLRRAALEALSRSAR